MCRLVDSCRSLGFLFLYLYMIMGGGEMFSLPHAVGVVIARLSFMITTDRTGMQFMIGTTTVTRYDKKEIH